MMIIEILVIAALTFLLWKSSGFFLDHYWFALKIGTSNGSRHADWKIFRKSISGRYGRLYEEDERGINMMRKEAINLAIDDSRKA